MPDPDDLVTIATYLLDYQAEMVRGYLESNGIPAVLVDQHTNRMNFAIVLFSGGARLQVRAADEERARQLLEEVESGAIESDLEDG